MPDKYEIHSQSVSLVVLKIVKLLVARLPEFLGLKIKSREFKRNCKGAGPVKPVSLGNSKIVAKRKAKNSQENSHMIESVVFSNTRQVGLTSAST